jgi:N-acetyl-anhydromuramyl-L-alanine amidase AmpD
MRCVRLSLLVLVGVLALAGVSSAAPPQSRFAALTNYTRAQRPESGIRFIVIHVTEGSFLGTVSWLRNPRAHSSANFVVGRDGAVQRLVPLHDVAWHAGNWAYNLRSVGIENVGYTADPAGFTMREYRASARIAAVIARRAVIPIDRRHIIGHSQVPNPNDPLQGGGIDSHTDPGRYWNWRLFMRLVERFAYPKRFIVHKHVGLQIDAGTLADRQVIAGKVPWRLDVTGPVRRVSFLVDGKVRWTDRIGPFAFAGGRPLDTFRLRNGKHVLEVRAYGSRSWARHRFVVRVKNEPFTLAPVGVKPKQKVAGVLPVKALFTGVPPARVLLYLDGTLVDHDTSPPYRFTWDTRRVKNGAHVLTLAGRARDGRVVRSRFGVVVANDVVHPAGIVASSLAEGQTVSGLQHWLVETSGSVAGVEFLVDGAVAATTTSAPHAWDWDATGATPGPHPLGVRVTGVDGRVAEQDFTVTVVAPAG